MPFLSADMDAATLYSTFVGAWLILSETIATSLLWIRAPYGRHVSNSWGPQISNRWGWIIMEGSVIVFATWFYAGASSYSLLQWIFFRLLLAHYVYRTLLFPLRIRTDGKKMPLMIVVFGMLHNLGNSYLIAYYIGHLGTWPPQWVAAPQFGLGALLYISGFVIHYRSDGRLIRLRAPGETGYKIPYGGLFRWVSCPNYFGELVEWTGFAVMTQMTGAWAFVAFTAANLVPRALAHHKWYCEKFSEYPTERKAILPYLL